MSTEFLDGYLPYLLQRADQLLSERFHRLLHEHGVQVSEWRVLAVLADDGQLTVGALTERSLLPQPTTTHAVARLEKRGEVSRRAGDVDGRQRLVVLTAAGRARAAALTKLARAELATTLASTDVDQIARLTEEVATLVHRLRDHADD